MGLHSYYDQIEIEEFPDRKKEYGNVDKSIIAKAAELLFGETKLTRNQYKELKELINDSYKKIGTCVLYQKSKVFNDFIITNNLDDVVGKKEVVINRSYGGILYTEDFVKVPQNINL